MSVETVGARIRVKFRVSIYGDRTGISKGRSIKIPRYIIVSLDGYGSGYVFMPDDLELLDDSSTTSEYKRCYACSAVTKNIGKLRCGCDKALCCGCKDILLFEQCALHRSMQK